MHLSWFLCFAAACSFTHFCLFLVDPVTLLKISQSKVAQLESTCEAQRSEVRPSLCRTIRIWYAVARKFRRLAVLYEDIEVQQRSHGAAVYVMYCGWLKFMVFHNI